MNNLSQKNCSKVHFGNQWLVHNIDQFIRHWTLNRIAAVANKKSELITFLWWHVCTNSGPFGIQMASINTDCDSFIEILERSLCYDDHFDTKKKITLDLPIGFQYWSFTNQNLILVLQWCVPIKLYTYVYHYFPCTKRSNCLKISNSNNYFAMVFVGKIIMLHFLLLFLFL